MYTPTGKPRGRPLGSPNKRTAAIKAAVIEAAARIEAELPGVFTGDAHALLVSVYKDTRYPIELRLDAAKAAIRFEKPALSSVEAKGEVRHVVRRVPMTAEEWAIERAEQDLDNGQVH